MLSQQSNNDKRDVFELRKTPHSTLVCYYQNVRGLRSKTIDLFNVTAVCTLYDVFAFTESGLNDDIYDAELFDLNQYTVFKNNRDFVYTTLKKGAEFSLR